MAFGCKVYDQYGSREVSCIASECEYSNGLHISEETILLEIVDEIPKSNVGKILRRELREKN